MTDHVTQLTDLTSSQCHPIGVHAKITCKVESQHGRLHFLISVNFDILLGFWFHFGGYNVNIHLYMIHFWNTLTLRKVQLPTDVSRLNCVFERKRRYDTSGTTRVCVTVLNQYQCSTSLKLKVDIKQTCYVNFFYDDYRFFTIKHISSTNELNKKQPLVSRVIALLFEFVIFGAKFCGRIRLIRSV